MKLSSVLAAAAWLAVSAGGPSAAWAQSAPAASAASGPHGGMGPRGMGSGMKDWRMSRDNTPGWTLMTRQERREHHDKMMSMSDRASCKAYMEEHHARMVERARSKGAQPPGTPRHDACERLHP